MRLNFEFFVKFWRLNAIMDFSVAAEMLRATGKGNSFSFFGGYDFREMLFLLFLTMGKTDDGSSVQVWRNELAYPESDEIDSFCNIIP